MPGPYHPHYSSSRGHHLDADDDDDDDGPLFMPNGDAFRFRASSASRGSHNNKQHGANGNGGSCSLHNTLTRRSAATARHSSIGCNTTMDDDVFEDSDLTNSAQDPPPNGAGKAIPMVGRGSTMFPHIVGMAKTSFLLRIWMLSVPCRRIPSGVER